jgi:hypothetical protein
VRRWFVLSSRGPATLSVQVFHEQDLVPEFVVDEFVGNSPCDEHPEAARAQAHLGAPQGSGHHLVGVRRHGGVRQPLAVEAAAGIPHVLDDRACRPGGCHLDDFAVVEPGSVLHRIEEQLAERGNEQVPFLGRQGAEMLRHESDEPLRSEQMT